MQIVVQASQKGGAGKTTLTGHLAIAAEQRGVKPVVMIDTDPQGSLSTWWNRRKADTPLLSPLPHLRDLSTRLEELRQGDVALVLIDTPPAITSSIREVMRVADLVVMPVRPSPHDLDAIGATINLAQAAGVPFVFAVTQAKLNARVTPQTVALLSAHGTVAFYHPGPRHLCDRYDRRQNGWRYRSEGRRRARSTWALGLHTTHVGR